MTPEQRHKCMSAIKAENTKPEILVRKYLFSKGLRFRIHVKTLPGKPDIVLPKYKTVIFINGCFWHGHDNCKYYRLPKSNIEYWSAKIERNKDRDETNSKQLESMGWHVIRLWECTLRHISDRQMILDELYNDIIGLNQSCVLDMSLVAEQKISYGGVKCF